MNDATMQDDRGNLPFDSAIGPSSPQREAETTVTRQFARDANHSMLPPQPGVNSADDLHELLPTPTGSPRTYATPVSNDDANDQAA